VAAVVAAVEVAVAEVEGEGEGEVEVEVEGVEPAAGCASGEAAGEEKFAQAYPSPLDVPVPRRAKRLPQPAWLQAPEQAQEPATGKRV
jgi:hypothetical protein